jgi:hypothetical protein
MKPLDPRFASADSIRESFAAQELTVEGAIDLAKRAHYVLEKRGMPYMSGMFETEESKKENWRGQLKKLLDFIEELDHVPDFLKGPAPQAPDTASPLSIGGLERLRWKGKTKADFARVFSILGPLVDCTAAEWERHFIGPNGEDMTGATDLHKLGLTSKNGTVQALAKAAGTIDPEDS